MVVSPNASTVDQLLTLAYKHLGDNARLLRIGSSITDQDLNKKCSIDFLSGSIKNKGLTDKAALEISDERKIQLMGNCQILFISFQQLQSQILDKSGTRFDTVIIDDASMITELDILQVLKYGGLRLVMIGNSKME